MMAASEVESIDDILSDVVSHLNEDNCGESKTPKSMRLIENKNGSLLLWSETNKYLYSTPSSTSNFKNASYQVLVTSISPMFDISNLKCSESFQHALLFGSNGIGIVELPRKYGNDGQFEGGKQICHCRLTILDESYFTHHLTTKVLQASWYPGSPNGTHVVALTSDNCLRFYDLTMPDQPMMRLPLFDSSDSTRSVGNFASVTGDLAVDFDIGLPSVDDLGVATYPIYIIQESGDVWALYCKFSQSRLVVEMQGPLTMNPPADDNYGCSYCSLICLPTTPITLAMATQTGTVHHCLVLPSQEDEEFGDFTVNDSSQQEALFVYESIQLDMNWIDGEIDDDDELNDRELTKINNLRLSGASHEGYICTSDGGVHNIALPWLQDMSKFLVPEGNPTVTDCSPEINAPAEISYLLCTQPSDESPTVRICGCVGVESFADDSTLLTLLSSGEIIYLKKGNSKKIIQSEFDKTDDQGGEKYTSPLRKLHGVGGFDTYIAKILAKNANVPVIRSGSNDETIPADVYYKLLTKTTQVLHEEYLQKMIKAKLEILKRCKILRSKKEEQIKEISRLKDNSNLMDKGDELAQKFETAQENMQSLYERNFSEIFLGYQKSLTLDLTLDEIDCVDRPPTSDETWIEHVLRAMHNTAPMLSHEEEEWGKELKTIQDKLVNLKRKSEMVKKKNENSILQSVPEKMTSSRNTVLTASQALKFRAHLKDQEDAIKTLVEDIGNLKIKIGA